jgi:hypothetical protein
MKIVKGVIHAPYRWLFSGTEGIGKTTFAATADRPLFLCIEEGANQLDVPRAFKDDGSPLQTYEDVCEAIDALTNDSLGFKTLVPDTLDALNAWIEDFVCRKNKWLDDTGAPNIEAPGYGKGYKAVGTEWRAFLARLERLQRAQGMNILALAHCHMKKYSPPDSEPYDRFDLKVSDTASALVREWVDAHFFAQHEVVVTKAQGESKKRGFATGDRIIHTVASAGISAKNRYGLPPVMKLNRDTYAEIERHRLMDHTAEFEKLLASTPAAQAKADELRAWFSKKPNKAMALAEARDRFSAKKEKEAA